MDRIASGLDGRSGHRAAIYYIEEHPKYLAKVKSFFDAVERNEFRIVTSYVTLRVPRGS